MKFKNKKNTDDAARILSITDKDGDTMTFSAYVDGKPQVVIDINTEGSAVSMTRAKALELAYAIITELEGQE